MSRREREILELVDCQGDEIDVAEIAAALGISQNTLKSKVKTIRAKLGAPAATHWLEDLPLLARQQGAKLAACEPDMPDDGEIRVDGEHLRV